MMSRTSQTIRNRLGRASVAAVLAVALLLILPGCAGWDMGGQWLGDGTREDDTRASSDTGHGREAAGWLLKNTQ